MRKPSSFAVGILGSALASALAFGCGLATEGAETWEVIEEHDASVDDEDAGGKRDAGGGGSKDAGSSGDSSDAAPGDDAGPDGADEEDAAPGDDGGDPGDGGVSNGDSGSLCCEGDPDVFPGQTAFFTKPNKCGNYDYDCDGVETKELGIGKACSRPAWSNGCNAPTIGFKDKIPECGDPGIKFVGCTARTLTGGCSSVEEAVLQGCR